MLKQLLGKIETLIRHGLACSDAQAKLNLSCFICHKVPLFSFNKEKNVTVFIRL